MKGAFGSEVICYDSKLTKNHIGVHSPDYCAIVAPYFHEIVSENEMAKHYSPSLKRQMMRNDYANLTQLEWEGARTQVLYWDRKGNNAVVYFEELGDPVKFVMYLKHWKILEENENRVSIPEETVFRKPVLVTIPLEAINPKELQNMLDWQRGELADKKYAALTEIKWTGIFTEELKWKRKGDKVVATFGDLEDATMFVHGYLKFWKGIKKRHTAETAKDIGIIREDCIFMNSMADNVVFRPVNPKRSPAFANPTIVEIPLEILRINGLRNIVERQRKQAARAAAKTPQP